MKNTGEKKITGTARTACIVAAVLAFVLAACMLAGSFIVLNLPVQEQQVTKPFDSGEASEERSYLEFAYLSDAFASYSVNENQEFYFVLDEEMIPYIICMRSGSMKKYEDIYNYTFDTTGNLPQPAAGRIEGVPQEMNEELRALAIEYFNEFWGEDIFNEENFREYVGDYYLDSTIQTKESASVSGFLSLAAYVFVGLGILFMILLGWKKPVSAENPAGISKEASFYLNGEEVTYRNGSVYAGNEEKFSEGNPAAGVIGALIGAAIGCVVWTVVYHLGYMASVVGLLTAYLAIKGYELLGRKRDIFGNVISILFSVISIVIGNYVGYAWVITDALNESAAGRGELTEVLRIMPQLLTEYDLSGAFIRDLVVGLIFGVLATAKFIVKSSDKKAEKTQEKAEEIKDATKE